MERCTFYAAFDRAAQFCRELSQTFVIEPLPLDCVFDFAAAKRPLDADGMVKFLGGRLLSPDQLSGVDSLKAKKYLWVDGKVPCWINLSVRSMDPQFTHIYVIASSDLTADEERFFHKHEGNPPFHVLGPPLPPDWLNLDTSGKFSVHWHLNRRNSA